MTADRCDVLCLDLPKAEALRQSRPTLEAATDAAAYARAIADPTRLTIAAVLGATDELCVCDLAWVVERPQNLVSHHLRLLRAAGMVQARREGKLVMCSLTDRGRHIIGAVLPDAEQVTA